MHLTYRPAGAAVLRRMTSSVGTMVVSFEMAGSETLRRSFLMLRRPTAAKSWRTVVSGGQNEAAVPMSSKPTTLTSPGMSRPSSCSARIAPRAISSLAAKMAVTSGRLRAGDVPDLAVPEPQEVPGGLPGAEGLVGVDHGVAGAGARVDHDDRDARRQDELGPVEEARLQ